ncbi:hypothetical protein ADIARSV_3493 [Arcticibacter svalbardensis MN12-7]|uniref:Activator of Hsp90 ATPase homologue 1/2-like C-terminal domain-containing protein n=1 Tax=Arcticibacter svalbardensis MN12-7 TaxID=1150600 RepID=R9GWS4_9SPHI|nr:SRPBCC domain-containing protein [Arcticibacter svalbardensis]EOR93414.1 hypothetical protein ADIARSV_3493 [Arcticibacter svalbardensis MN12-7]
MGNSILQKQPIIIEEVFNTSVSTVWKAITDKDEMKIWYFDLDEFKAEKGFKFQFSGGASPEEQYLHLCEVTDVIPEKELIYSWSYDGYPGKSFVMFDLSEQGNNTLLKLTHSGLETFPQENPAFSAHNFQLGWNEIIHNSLKKFLKQ